MLAADLYRANKAGMRILIVSNLYPPHHQGGYELRCAQVTEHLQRRGHSVRVVTSSFQISGSTHEVSVREDVVNGVPVSRFLRQHRLDQWHPGGRRYNLGVITRQLRDISRFAEILDEFKPDLVSWWNLEGVTKIVLQLPHQRGIPSLHWIEDNWMIREFGAEGEADLPLWHNFWTVKWGPRPGRPAIRAVVAQYERRVNRRGIPTRPFRVPPAHLCFVSEFLRHLHRQAGLDVTASDVIYGGVSPERFFNARNIEGYAQVPLRLLYAGYLDERRGLHTIVEALSLVPAEQRDRMHLSVAQGGPVVPDEYVSGVMDQIAKLGLSRHVTFLGRVSHDAMPRVFAEHDILVFASTRNEGMPLVMMEAMCAGCAVPNTGSGGAIELSERTGTPLFPKEHPFALSRLLSALERDRARVADIALRGQQTVLRDFTIERMLQRAEDLMVRVAERQPLPQLEPAV
ncbi:MAG: glycosyltransferase family 4 protein [Phycisphaerae bacterium]|nr:glycosyltransferase family 4 protein [Gemmatimonadaceae bacterium]